MQSKGLRGFCQQAKKLGALRAKTISPNTVVTAPWVRLKCQFGCDGFGQCLTCPPFSPSPEQTRAVVDSYKKAILIQGDDHVDISKLVFKIEREAFLTGYYKAYAMGSGPCRLCRTCDVTEPCKKGLQARPSMEASGIDVFQTVRNNGLHIEVLTDYQCPGTYFGLILID